VSVRVLGAVACAGGVLAAAGAPAETYRVLDGRLRAAGTGASAALDGALEISSFDPACPAVVPSLLVDDFELRAGARRFGPQEPVILGGGLAALVRLPDEIRFDGDAVDFARLRSGGEIVAQDASGGTVRYLDFRAEGPDAGRLVGHLGDSELPRRISLVGTLYEVDHRFPALSPRGGYVDPDVVEIPDYLRVLDLRAGGSGVFGRVDFLAGDSASLYASPIRRGVLSRVTGSESVAIEGAIVSIAPSSLRLLDPSLAVFSPLGAPGPREWPLAAPGGASATPPTLAELGITAPSGADLTFVEAGALTVRTDGDLLVAGGVIDVPGLTSLTLVAAGSITVEGPLELPADVTLALQSGRLAIGGDPPSLPRGVIRLPVYPLPRDVVTFPPLIIVDPCLARPFDLPIAAERELGSFSLVASAAKQVEIDFEPRRHAESEHPGHRKIATVAILGSAELDIRDVDERSLRLGPGEAEPTRRHGRDGTRRADLNRDGEPDLVARFDAREAGIARDAVEVCLFGETTDGAAIEGCDAIAPRPERSRPTGRDHDEDDGDEDDDERDRERQGGDG
jgi:hypothetical protein